ncbi:tetratricopeptide repeat protein [Aureimonas sp. D3]|uniref:tetratricopeptide repeat protein n=1 Tax=Aureimonas sp. D3 TaxID=1638164 RepID=UPI000A7DF9A0|nr:hypothetical protein [Aureimonas sp. D3]
MSNDIFIREVNEELRQERARALWLRYGTMAIVAAVVIVLGVGGYVLWQRHLRGVEAADGDKLLSATTLIEDGKTQEGRTILQGLTQTGVATYPALARLRLAELDLADDPAKGVAAFDAIAGDASVPQDLRDMAALRAAYALVDHGSLADVRQRAERLTTDGEPLRYGAREAIGLAAWKAGDVDTARSFFTELQEDFGTPAGIKRRAGLMVELIEAEHGAKDAPAADAPAKPVADDAEASEAQSPPQPSDAQPAAAKLNQPPA